MSQGPICGPLLLHCPHSELEIQQSARVKPGQAQTAEKGFKSDWDVLPSSHPIHVTPMPTPFHFPQDIPAHRRPSLQLIPEKATGECSEVRRERAESGIRGRGVLCVGRGREECGFLCICSTLLSNKWSWLI